MTGTRNDLFIDETAFHLGVFQAISKNIQIFNANSNGGVVLNSEMLEGDFATSSYFKSLAQGMRRRDPNNLGEMAAADIQKLEDLTERSVKIHTKWSFNQLKNAFNGTLQNRFGGDLGAFSQAMGAAAGEAKINDQLEDAIASGVAALSSQPANLFTQPGNGPIDITTLNNGRAKLGDQMSNVRSWLMHSTVYTALVSDQVTSEAVDTAGGIALYSGTPGTYNKPVLVTDSESMVEDFGGGGAERDYYTLGLTESGIMVTDSEATSMEAILAGNGENILVQYRYEGVHNVGVKGFEWVTASGANPDRAALLTSANWNAVDTSTNAHKRRAGVAIKTRH